jgi:hypothetical protein
MPPSPQEAQLVKILLASNEHLPFAATHLDPQWLVHPVVKRIVEYRLNGAHETGQSSAALFAAFHEDLEAQQLFSAVLADQTPVPQPDKQLADVLRHLRDDAINNELQRLTRELAHPDMPDERRLELLRRQKELRAQRQQPLG